MSNGPAHEEVQLLPVLGGQTLGGVEAAKVGGAVDDDALDGHEEATVEADGSVGLDNFDDAINQAVEFTGASPSNFEIFCENERNNRLLSNIRSQTGTGKVQWVDNSQRGCTRSATRGQVHHEELPELLVLVNPAKNLNFCHFIFPQTRP